MMTVMIPTVSKDVGMSIVGGNIERRICRDDEATYQIILVVPTS